MSRLTLAVLVSRTLLFSFLAVSLLDLTCSAQGTRPRCYYPDGSLNDNGFACNTTAVDTGGHSPCCHSGDTCLTTGVCHQAATGNMYRLGCTDRNWRDPSCPQICVDKSRDDHKGGRGIQACGVLTGKACCLPSHEPCCNDTAAAHFDFAPGTPMAILDKSGINMLSLLGSVRVTAQSSSQIPAPVPTPTPTKDAELPQTSSKDGANGPVHVVDSEGTTAEIVRLRKIVIGVSVSLGILLAVAVAAAAIFAVKYRLMKQQHEGPHCGVAPLPDPMAPMPPVKTPPRGPGFELYGSPVPSDEKDVASPTVPSIVRYK